LIVKLTHLIQWLVSFNAGADFVAAFIEKPANGLSPSIRFENRAIGCGQRTERQEKRTF
jgi:hypothetical protein